MKKPVVLGFRIEASDAELLRLVCKARRENMSDFIRRAVIKELARLSYLSEDERTALGISNHGVGHCGKYCKNWICDEPKLDILCVGCPCNWGKM